MAAIAVHRANDPIALAAIELHRSLGQSHRSDWNNRSLRTSHATRQNANGNRQQSAPLLPNPDSPIPTPGPKPLPPSDSLPHHARMTDLSLSQAVAVLHQGGVIAYPTEAVWGLGCDPYDQAAVTRLLQIKQRPVEKGLIVVAAELEPLRPLLDLTALPAERLAAVLASWPGAHTWVLPAAAQAPPWVTGAHRSIAVRISAHPQVAALCRAWGGALVSTSANRGGEPPARQRAELDPQLLSALDGVVGGETGGLAQPTPIRDAVSGEILRA